MIFSASGERGRMTTRESAGNGPADWSSLSSSRPPTRPFDSRRGRVSVTTPIR
jgi:hypothetical protein